MGTFLFNDIIFGPVRSRRLGASLGVNLIPVDSKWCSFNCIYCECGWTNRRDFAGDGFPLRHEVREALREKLCEMKSKESPLDVITFAGNGEPTLHPDFPGIIDDTIELRNFFCPEVEIAVLSNSTMLHDEKVRNALACIEQNILKLDSAIEETFRLLNQPAGEFNLDRLIEGLEFFRGKFILQTMFVRGTFKGKPFDNTTEKELDAWQDLVKRLQPGKVMIYTIARNTPANDIQKIPLKKLNEIAQRIENMGIPVQVSS